MPRADTRERVACRLARSITYIAAGEWDSLCEGDATNIVSHPRRLLGAIRGFSAMITGLAPLGVLWGIQQTTLALQGDTLRNVTVGAIVWALISFLLVLDPYVSTKLAILRELTDTLPLIWRRK